VNLPPAWDIHCPNFYSKRSQQWSKKKGENRSDKKKDKIFKHRIGSLSSLGPLGPFSFFGFSGLFGLFGPGGIGATWSSLPHATERALLN